MARGDDAAVLDRENRQQYGDFLNAADLIAAHASTFDPALQKVLLLPTDEEETNKVMASLGDYSDRFDLREGETLIAAAVHGSALVGVIEKPDGRHRKAVAGYDDSFVAPRLTPQEAAQAEAAKVAGEVASETNRIREEAAERIRQAEEEAQRDADERIKQIHAEAEAKVEKAQADAAKEAPAEAEAAPAPKAGAKPRASRSRSTSTSKPKAK